MNKVLIEVKRMLSDEKILKKTTRINNDLLKQEYEIEEEDEEEEELEEDLNENQKGSSRKSLGFCTGQPFNDSDIDSVIDLDNMDISRDLQKYIDSTENHNYDDNFKLQQVVHNGDDI